jgi:hypothetical protein
MSPEKKDGKSESPEVRKKETGSLWTYNFKSFSLPVFRTFGLSDFRTFGLFPAKVTIYFKLCSLPSIILSINRVSC